MVSQDDGQPVQLSSSPVMPSARVASGHDSRCYRIEVDGTVRGLAGLGRWPIVDKGSHSVISTGVMDQAALFGLLRQIRDLGLPLIAVIPTDSGANPPDLQEQV